MINRKKKKNIRPDYQNKNLKNPFYRQKKEKKTNNYKRWFYLIALVILLGAGIWFFLLFDFWHLKNIKINGLTRVSQEEIELMIINREEKKKFIFFNEKNFFLFNKDEFKAEVLEKYNFSDLEIKKTIPDTIELKIIERPYAFIFQEGSDFYYASSDGFIISETVVTEEDKNSYFILENKSEAVFISTKNKINLRQEFLDFTFAIESELENFPDLNPEKFIIDQELNTLITEFKDGPNVLFNIKNDPVEQVADLALVKKEKIKDNFNSTKYIDLRYGNRIFIND